MFASSWRRTLTAAALSSSFILYLRENVHGRKGLKELEPEMQSKVFIKQVMKQTSPFYNQFCSMFAKYKPGGRAICQTNVEEANKPYQKMDLDLQFLLATHLETCFTELARTGTNEPFEFINQWFKSILENENKAKTLIEELTNTLYHCKNDMRVNKQADKLTMHDKKQFIKYWLSERIKPSQYLIKKADGPKRLFLDPIHGSVVLHPLLGAIIDTPQFQRLRNLKQLGGVSRVFPGAQHSRFEHSIGVCHLAGTLVRKLKENQPELEISERDILCVEIAGLCHDLGHGPFSHLFDNKFLEKAVKEEERKVKHEELSCKVFDYILENNPHIKRKLTPEEIKFINEQISGKMPRTYCNKKKDFLYEIVANKRNGVDVDKWDYLARDHFYLGLPNAFDFHIINFVRALKVEMHEKNGNETNTKERVIGEQAEDGNIKETNLNGKKEFMICARDIKVDSMYTMFQSRRRLHSVVLQHRVVNAIELMICDALLEAKDDLKYGKNKMNLTESIRDCDAFTELTDNVYYDILGKNDGELNEKLKKAKAIIQRIEERDLYGAVLNAIKEGNATEDTETANSIKHKITKHFQEFVQSKDINKEDFELQLIVIDFGKGLADPVAGKMWFYKKSNINRAVQLHPNTVSAMLPKCFTETMLRVYCKYHCYETDKLKKAETIFKDWLQKLNDDYSGEFRFAMHISEDQPDPQST